MTSTTGKKLIVGHSTREGWITKWKPQFFFFYNSLGPIEIKNKNDTSHFFFFFFDK